MSKKFCRYVFKFKIRENVALSRENQRTERGQVKMSKKMSKKICRYISLSISFFCVRTIFFFKFLFYGSFNAEFRKDFRHGNNSSVTSKSPSLPKFKTERGQVKINGRKSVE